MDHSRAGLRGGGMLQDRIRDEELQADFTRSLTREIMRSELIRIRALIATTCLLMAALGLLNVLAPDVVRQIWRGGLTPLSVFANLGLFVLFEIWVHAAIVRHIRLGHDLPVVRRYLGALIETSFPTAILVMQVESMGAVPALGFIVPLAYSIFIITSTLRLDFTLSAFTGLVAGGELFAVALHSNPQFIGSPEPEIYYHAARSVILVLCGVLAGAVGLQLRRQFIASFEAATARDRVTHLFGQHVSPQVVERLLTEGTTLAGDVRRVAVMFVDFRGFTAAARSRSPQQVVERLDGVFEVLVEILESHGGIVNKFLGDGFLGLVGAPFETPDAARRAVAAAREMLAAMERINATSEWPLRIGIGIHFGEVVAGSIGSPRRKEYTVIGDTVNFASRLEALNKELDTQLLISAEVMEALGEPGELAIPRSDVMIRGYDRPVTVWQIG